MKYTGTGAHTYMAPDEAHRRLSQLAPEELPIEISAILWNYSRALRRIEELEKQRRYEDGILIKRQERVTSHALEHLTRDGLDPHGYFVYVLMKADGSALYVGQSTNVLARLGAHMGDREKREQTALVRIYKCETFHEMSALEIELIKKLQPELNIMHSPIAQLAKRGN